MKKQLKQWEQFEEEVAELLDGKRQKGSGNGPVQKGDVKCSDVLVECKFTSKPAYTLNYKTFDKIIEEARNLARIPLFACRGKDGDFFCARVIDTENFGFDIDDVYETQPYNDTVIENLKVNKEGIFTLKSEYSTWEVLVWEIPFDD